MRNPKHDALVPGVIGGGGGCWLGPLINQPVV